MTKQEKVFLVFNTACFGDGLVCNALCQNIKRLYPESRIVFIVNKPFYEVAKFQKDVDEVVVFDKKGEHKGLKGVLKFVKSFPYKRAHASFLTYANFRNYWISIFTGCFRVFSSGKVVGEQAAQEQILSLLSKLTDAELKNVPIKYEVKGELPESLKALLPSDNYIAISAITKKNVKNIPLGTVVELVRRLNELGYKPILTGTGEINETYSKYLSEVGCQFVDLINKTSIYELACVFKTCKGVISADTGSMHLGYALDVPTVAVFYEQETLGTWAPRESLYRVKVVANEQSVENILAALEQLIKKEVVNV